MATTKRGAKRGAKARTARKAPRARARKAGSKKPAAKKSSAKRASATKASVKKSGGRKPAPKSTGNAAAALTTKLKAQFARERRQLEQRLTETVREIGLLRQHEMRAKLLERQLAERDATIATLRRELEMQQGQTSPTQSHAQPSLDFGGGGTVGLDDLDETATLEEEDDDLI